MTTPWSHVTDCGFDGGGSCYTIRPMEFSSVDSVKGEDWLYCLGFWTGDEFTALYIGHSKDFKQRLSAHVSSAKTQDSKKDLVLRGLLQDGVELVLRPIKPMEREDDEELAVDNYRGCMKFTILNDKSGDREEEEKGPKKSRMDRQLEEAQRMMRVKR